MRIFCPATLVLFLSASAGVDPAGCRASHICLNAVRPWGLVQSPVTLMSLLFLTCRVVDTPQMIYTEEVNPKEFLVITVLSPSDSYSIPRWKGRAPPLLSVAMSASLRLLPLFIYHVPLRHPQSGVSPTMTTVTAQQSFPHPVGVTVFTDDGSCSLHHRCLLGDYRRAVPCGLT